MTVSRSLTELAGWITVGAIVAGAFLVPIKKSRELSIAGSFELRVLKIASGWWALLSALMVVAESADANGVPISDAVSPSVLLYLIPATDYAIAWIVTMACALIVFVLSTVASQWRHLVVPLVLTLIGLLAPIVVGGILVGPNHDFGSDTGAIVRTLGSAAFGGVVVLCLRLAAGRAVDSTALRRTAYIGAVAVPIVLGAEIVVVWFTLAGAPLLGSLAGQISTAILLSLIACTAMILALRAGASRLADRWNAQWMVPVATILGAVVLGGEIALTRFLTPQYYADTTIPEIFLGFNVPDAPTAAVLFGHWRINVLIAAIAAAGVIGYLLAVLRLRRRGDDWPVGRIAAWLLGWAVIVFATSSGFGRYSAPDFGIHMIVHMTLNMVGPLFLVMGGAITLFLRASPPSKIAGPHEMITSALNSPALNRLYHPLLVFALFVGSYYALYLTPLFGNLIRYHWAHQAMNIHFLVVGYLFFGLAIGIDRTPRQLPHVGKLGFVFAAMPFHAFFGVALMSMTGIIAEEFYAYLDLPWMDLAASQRVGGGVAWAGSEIPLLIVVIALVAQWSRIDNREAKRKDRHYDSGLDTEYDAYNEMLRSLSERERGVGAARGPMPAPSPGSQSGGEDS